MTQAGGGARRWLPGVTATVILVALGYGLAANPFLRDMLGEAWGRVSLAAVLATVPAQAVSTLMCAGALAALRPGVSYLACLGSRLLRDAGGNLLVFMPGLGEAIGARALVLAGGRTRAAISASALDTFAEVIGQLPFIALAIGVLPRFWDKAELPVFPGNAWALAGMAAGIVLAAGAGVYLWWRLGGRHSRLARRLREEGTLMRHELARQRGGMPASILLHFIAWFAGGVQLWMAAAAMGLELGFWPALAIDAVAYAARGILFFVPAGLVLQEAGLVGAGLAFGVPAADALALGLVLRLRDVVFGAALVIWPVMEFRLRGAKRA
jgi:hypothetical protein